MWNNPLILTSNGTSKQISDSQMFHLPGCPLQAFHLFAEMCHEGRCPINPTGNIRGTFQEGISHKNGLNVIDYDTGILIHDWNLYILVIRFGADSVMQLPQDSCRGPRNCPNWREKATSRGKAMGSVGTCLFENQVGNRNWWWICI